MASVHVLQMRLSLLQSGVCDARNRRDQLRTTACTTFARSMRFLPSHELVDVPMSKGTIDKIEHSGINMPHLVRPLVVYRS